MHAATIFPWAFDAVEQRCEDEDEVDEVWLEKTRSERFSVYEMGKERQRCVNITRGFVWNLHSKRVQAQVHSFKCQGLYLGCLDVCDKP